MREIAIALGAAILGCSLLVQVTHANQVRTYSAPRYHSMPQFRPVPQIQQRIRPAFRPEMSARARFTPGIRVNPGTHARSGYQHFGNVGRHGLPIVPGRFGMHEMRNRTKIGAISGVLLAGGVVGSIGLEDYIESINLSGPSAPVVNPCGGPCTAFGALSISNDGTYGTAWNYPSIESAIAAAQANCTAQSSEACNTLSIGGSQWIGGLHCDNGTFHWGIRMVGNSAQDAITNLYVTMAQSGNYSLDQCGLVALIAADGSHLPYEQEAQE